MPVTCTCKQTLLWGLRKKSHLSVLIIVLLKEITVKSSVQRDFEGTADQCSRQESLHKLTEFFKQAWNHFAGELSRREDLIWGIIVCLWTKTAWFNEYSLDLSLRNNYFFFMSSEPILMEVNLHSQHWWEWVLRCREALSFCHPTSNWESLRLSLTNQSLDLCCRVCTSFAVGS